jgi:hypothetical protein
MPYFHAPDGTELFYRDWGAGQVPAARHHCSRGPILVGSQSGLAVGLRAALPHTGLEVSSACGSTIGCEANIEVRNEACVNVD